MFCPNHRCLCCLLPPRHVRMLVTPVIFLKGINRALFGATEHDRRHCFLDDDSSCSILIAIDAGSVFRLHRNSERTTGDGKQTLEGLASTRRYTRTPAQLYSPARWTIARSIKLPTSSLVL